MENTVLLDILAGFVFGLPLIVPLWKIHAKAGMRPALSLLVFLPYLGLLITTMVLAFSRWPATAWANTGECSEGVPK